MRFSQWTAGTAEVGPFVQPANKEAKEFGRGMEPAATPANAKLPALPQSPHVLVSNSQPRKLRANTPDPTPGTPAPAPLGQETSAQVSSGRVVTNMFLNRGCGRRSLRHATIPINSSCTQDPSRRGASGQRLHSSAHHGVCSAMDGSYAHDHSARARRSTVPHRPSRDVGTWNHHRDRTPLRGWRPPVEIECHHFKSQHMPPRSYP
ncbi:hypothetical protein QBC39DRAFT_364658 [Podospora conica]|nr:hypothetical protein QBC39DRAFT_364658 [Schizothecium conicum]